MIKDISDRVAVMLRGDLVEEGPVESVLQDPQHEYTKMLMSAVPDLAGRKTIGEGAAAEPEPESKATHILVAAGPSKTDSADGTAASVTAPLLQTMDVALAYGKAQILDGINLTLEPGDCTLLLGESGSGRATLSRCIAGLSDDYSGAVRLRGAGAREVDAQAHERTACGHPVRVPVAVLLAQSQAFDRAVADGAVGNER